MRITSTDRGERLRRINPFWIVTTIAAQPDSGELPPDCNGPELPSPRKQAGRSLVKQWTSVSVVCASITAVLAGVACVDPCGNEVTKEVSSPDQQHVVVVYVRGCGTASDGVTHLNLRRRNEKVSFDPERSFATIDRTRAVNVTWESSRSVLVTYQADSGAKTWPTENEPILVRYLRMQASINAVPIGSTP